MTHQRGRQEAKVGKNMAEKGIEMPLGLGQNNFVDYVMNGSTFNSTRVTLVHTSVCWCLLCIHFLFACVHTENDPCAHFWTLSIARGCHGSTLGSAAKHQIKGFFCPQQSNAVFWRGDDESQMLMPGALMSVRVKRFPKNE